MQPTQNTRNSSSLSPRATGTGYVVGSAAAHINSPSILGIWRLGQAIHASSHSQLFTAQPADADGSPRYDYVLRTVSETRSTREASVAQIERFAKAATVTSHPNLIVVLDSSVHSAHPFLVMPRLVGATLSQVMLDGPRQALPVALWAVRQAAQGLAALHAAHWVHGDVKPDNLFLGQQGHLTILDLGFAQPLGSKPEQFMGTPRYAAPEVKSEQPQFVTAAADVYSLGQVLFELLAWSSPTVKNPSAMEPVADLIAEMINEDDHLRPTAQDVASRLLRLEIETLGEHIQPAPVHARRAA